MHLASPRFFALALLLSPAPAAAMSIDSFTDELPPNPCLPVSGQRVVFAGLYCDGVSCPPGSMVSCGEDEVLQTGLAGVLGGRRQVNVSNGAAETAHARVDAPTQTLRVGFDGTTADSYVEIDYGTPFDPYPQPDALNLNVESVHLVLAGDISPSKPLLLSVELLSDAPVAPRPSATALRIIDQPGIVTIPISDFVPGPVPGFTPSDVDDIQVGLANCLDYYEGCPDPKAVYASQQFSLGPIEFVTGPTPARATSWGRLKTIYR